MRVIHRTTAHGLNDAHERFYEATMNGQHIEGKNTPHNHVLRWERVLFEPAADDGLITTIWGLTLPRRQRQFNHIPSMWGLRSEFANFGISGARFLAIQNILVSGRESTSWQGKVGFQQKKMLGQLGGGESAADGIPQELAHDLIHLMAHQKMIVETQHILSRCHNDDAIVVVGSDLKLRLDILAIDEELENALLNHDPDDSSKDFVRLLERFDSLVSRCFGVWCLVCCGTAVCGLYRLPRCGCSDSVFRF